MNIPSTGQHVAVTLFSGMGSSSKALRDLNFNVLAHDIMPEAVNTLTANGFYARRIDVRKINYSGYPEVTVLAGGPPCQPFSQASDNDGRYDERDMIPEFLRAVAELLPKLFVMEEVQTLTWAKHRDYLERVESDMRALGYVVEHRVLNAADYGIPQARKRLFVVGVREDVAQGEMRQKVLGGPIAWPEKHSRAITMAAALGWTEADCLLRNSMVPDERAHCNDRCNHGEGGCCLWPMSRPAMTVVGSFRPEVMAAPGYRKAGDPPRQATPGSVVVTREERLILQDMPTDWVLCGSEAKKDLQVGNSVPCGLIRDLIDVNIP